MNILSYFFASGLVKKTGPFLSPLLPAVLLLPLAPRATGQEPAFTLAEWKTSAAFVLPELPGAPEESQPSAEASAGLKLVFPQGEARAYRTLPQTGTAELAAAGFPGCLQTLKGLSGPLRYGLALSPCSPRLPLLLKAGTVSYGRSIARLKSPAPAGSLSPLRKSFTVNCSLGSSLPTLTGAGQTPSLYAALTKGPLRPEAAVFSDRTVYAALRGKLALSPHTRLQGAVTAARFLLESSSTLESAGAAFDKGWYQAGMAEAVFISPAVKLAASAGLHQSPYGGKGLWLQGALRSGLGFLQLDAAGFCLALQAENPKSAPLVGGSSVCRVSRQAEVNPQLLFLPGSGGLALRLGLHALWQEKVTSTKYADSYQTCKLGAGAALEGRSLTVKGLASAVNTGTRGDFHRASSIPERYYSGSLLLTLTGNLGRAQLSLTAKHYPREPLRPSLAEKQLYSASLSLSPAHRRLDLQAGTEASWKEGARSGGCMTGKATARLGRGRLRTVLTCALSLPF